MPDLTPSERLQPALLDRLTDDEPDKQVESERDRVIDVERLRVSVIRDLGWLLNTGWMAESLDEERHEEVLSSVLNYGIGHLEGRAASSLTKDELEKMLVWCIQRFEPRILPETLSIRTVLIPGQMDRNAVQFEIHGQLWAHPVPLAMFLRTEIDLESGHVELEDNKPDGAGGKGR